MKQAIKECGYCKEKERKAESYREEIENEKIRECQKALEREKIAKGMMCTKADEIGLKDLQIMQMQERKCIEREEKEIEMMWHQVLLDDGHRKEYLEVMDAKRRLQETADRRRSYDEQIASANKKRQELIRQEREKENRKLEKIKKKMEQDHYEAIKKKKDQQMTNKMNFIEGHENKLLRLRNEKMKAREIDNGTIRVALEELQRERERNSIQMRNMQMEKLIGVENFHRQKLMASALEEQADKIADEWRQIEQEKNDEHKRQMEREKRTCKEKAAVEYKKHIQIRNVEVEKAKQERTTKMERVKRSAFSELQRKVDSANQELKRQLDYRHALSCQIKDNEKHLERELMTIENKDKTFTMKAQYFKDVMAAKLTSSTARVSTNPVHPFRRLMESKKTNTPFLPSLR